MERFFKNLELLKIRFGETSLHECEIMLRDVDDSKRVNSKGIKTEILTATIISQVFWPQLPTDSIRLHKLVETCVWSS